MSIFIVSQAVKDEYKYFNWVMHARCNSKGKWATTLVKQICGHIVLRYSEIHTDQMSGCYLEPCTYSSCVYILVKLQCVLEWPTAVTMAPFPVFQRRHRGFACDGLWRQTWSDFWHQGTSWTDTKYMYMYNMRWMQVHSKPVAGELNFHYPLAWKKWAHELCSSTLPYTSCYLLIWLTSLDTVYSATLP